ILRFSSIITSLFPPVNEFSMLFKIFRLTILPERTVYLIISTLLEVIHTLYTKHILPAIVPFPYYPGISYTFWNCINGIFSHHKHPSSHIFQISIILFLIKLDDCHDSIVGQVHQCISNRLITYLLLIYTQRLKPVSFISNPGYCRNDTQLSESFPETISIIVIFIDIYLI